MANWDKVTWAQWAATASMQAKTASTQDAIGTQGQVRVVLAILSIGTSPLGQQVSGL